MQGLGFCFVFYLKIPQNCFAIHWRVGLCLLGCLPSTLLQGHALLYSNSLHTNINTLRVPAGRWQPSYTCKIVKMTLKRHDFKVKIKLYIAALRTGGRTTCYRSLLPAHRKEIIILCVCLHVFVDVKSRCAPTFVAGDYLISVSSRSFVFCNSTCVISSHCATV